VSRLTVPLSGSLYSEYIGTFPDGYTTVTVSKETAKKRTEVVEQKELIDAVEYATNVVSDQTTLSTAELIFFLEMIRRLRLIIVTLQ